MNLKKILTKNVISMEVKGETKEEIISYLVEILFNAGKIKDKSEVYDCVMKRESQMSTGIQSGIAIPHGKSAFVTELVACVAISREGKEFKALDGQKSHIFVMTVSPAEKTGPHVQFLADISRLLTKKAVRESILTAANPEEIIKSFS